MFVRGSMIATRSEPEPFNGTETFPFRGSTAKDQGVPPGVGTYAVTVFDAPSIIET